MTMFSNGTESTARFAAGARMRWRRLQRFIHVGFLLAIAAGCSAPKVGSIGAVLGRNSDTGAVHVRDVPTGLGADRAGLIPGDRLKMVDGVLLDELTAAQIKRILRGEVDSVVRLTVIRGEEVLQLEIVRQPLGGARQMRPAEERIE